jgi:phage-related baseplate assembly protein
VSYAAEPYAQFVQDMLLALTGGVTRQEFQFLPEQMPFKLTAPGPVVGTSVQIFGQANGAYRRFLLRTDYALLDDFSIQWKTRQDGTRAADAVWPDDGTTFYANFEYLAPGGAVPQLTDRNPGSVVRLIAESFAREYAMFSQQLEAVYRAGFVATAGGRDLDQLAVLVGITRRLATFAGGTVVFGRSTPAPADIFIPAGTRVSTSQPPPLVFATTAPQTLRRGNLSVEAPIQSLNAGAGGIVDAGTIQVLHRPILGIETVSNTVATQFAGTSEDDTALRARVQRALETAGQATTGALLGALTSIPGVREKDVRIEEDPLAHPGVVKLNVALSAMADTQATGQQPGAALLQTLQQALDIIEETRPVGVRVLSNLQVAPPPGSAIPPNLPSPPPTEAPVSLGTNPNPTNLFLPVNVSVRVWPTTATLTAKQKTDLVQKCQSAVNDFLLQAGIGEFLIYNRLITALMAVDNVLDVRVEMYPQANPEQPHDKNLVPDNPSVRPTAGVVDVQLGGSLLMLDITVAVTLKGASLTGDPGTARAAALELIQDQLRNGLQKQQPSTLSAGALRALLSDPDTYSVTDLHYRVEYQDAGVRIHQQDVTLPLSGTEQLWVRSVAAS